MPMDEYDDIPGPPMPNDLLQAQQLRDEWSTLVACYLQSVEQILSYPGDPRVPDWLAEAARQFGQAATRIGQGAEGAHLMKAASTAHLAHAKDLADVFKRAPALYQAYRASALVGGAPVPIRKAHTSTEPEKTIHEQTFEIISLNKLASGEASDKRHADELTNREFPELYQRHRDQIRGAL